MKRRQEIEEKKRLIKLKNIRHFLYKLSKGKKGEMRKSLNGKKIIKFC